MGGCTSRPSKEEVERHLNSRETKNDDIFCPSPQDLHPTDDWSFLEQQVEMLRNLKKQNEIRMESVTKGSSTTETLNIEIQVGRDFYSTTSCIKPKPYVTAELVPNGEVQRTFSADPDLPYWYDVICISYLTKGFEKLVIKAWAEKSLKNPEFLGEIQFSIAELRDQELRQGWYKLEGPSSGSLKLRVQLIYEFRDVLEKIDQRYAAIISKANKRIADLKEYGMLRR